MIGQLTTANPTRTKPRTLVVWLTVFSLSFGLIQAQPTRAADANTAAPQGLNRLAHHGDFDLLLNRLNTRFPDDAGLADVHDLVKELRQYQTHHRQNTKQRRQAYAKAIKRVKKKLDATQYEDAMIAAIEAHDLADDPGKLLKMPTIKELVKKTAAKAKQARQDTDWVRSLSLYRMLHLLYEKQNRYRDEVRRVRRHVRVLGLYAPDVLQKLYEQEAKRNADKASKDSQGSQGSRKGQITKDQGARKKDTPGHDSASHESTKSSTEESAKNGQSTAGNAKADEGDDADDADDAQDGSSPMDNLRKPPVPKTQTETWQTRLRGVKQPMLEKTLRWAAAKHVDQAGYKPLLLGGLEGVEILLETDGLSKTFAGLKDRGDVKRFKQYLERTAASLKRLDKDAGRLDAEGVIDRVLAMNQATVDLPDRVLIYEMTEGATSKLDQFTSVIWPYDLTQFARSTRGNFKGVGIKIRGSDLGIEVVSPLENTPAQKAGIKAGDVIVSVNGKDARTWSLNRAVNQITGPEGTPVTLGIARDGKQLEFDLKRAKIDIQSVRGWKHRPGGGWNYWIDRDDRIGYVRISQFLPQTADDLDHAVNRMQNQGSINGLIVDLRFNPGGLLKSAIEVSNRFLKRGPIVSTVNGDGRRNHTERARALNTYKDFPVVVLINQGSASASEIVSGALQDYDRALIVGNRSFGKGSVQDLFALGNQQARLKLTRQYYQLPDGRIIHRKPDSKTWGIEPDLHVRMSDQQVAQSLEMRQEADVLRSAKQAQAKHASEGDGQGQGKDAEAGSNPERSKSGADKRERENEREASGAEAQATQTADGQEGPKSKGNSNSGQAGETKRVKAEDILLQGADPQLETALLILKTRLVSDRLATAWKNDNLDAQAQAKRSDTGAKTSP